MSDLPDYSALTAARLEIAELRHRVAGLEAAMRKEIMAVLAETVDAHQESVEAWADAKAEAWHTKEADDALADLKAENDRLKALVGDFDDYLKHKGDKHAFDEWHAWRYQRSDGGKGVQS